MPAYRLRCWRILAWYALSPEEQSSTSKAAATAASRNKTENRSYLSAAITVNIRPKASKVGLENMLGNGHLTEMLWGIGFFLSLK
jgi:hypothetical protein